METTVRARMDVDLKARFESILSDCGLSVSAALRMFAENVVRNEGLPFEVTRRPSAQLLQAIRETEEIIASNHSGFNNLDELMEAMKHGK